MNSNTFSGIFTVYSLTVHSPTFAYGTLINKGGTKEETLFLRAKINDPKIIERAGKNWVKGFRVFASGELRRDEWEGKESLTFIVHQAYTVFEDVAAKSVDSPKKSTFTEPAVELSAASANISDDLLKF